jgi:hypothetical protein
VNAEHLGDFRLAPTFGYHPQRFLLLNRRERELRVTPSAFGPSARNPELRPLLDHQALKLRETRQHVHHELAGSRLCFDMLSQALEGCARIFNLSQQVKEITQRPAQAVQFPDNERIAGSETIQSLVQLGAIPATGFSARLVFLVNSGATVVFQCADLDRRIEGAEDRVGRIDRFATVADAIERFQKSAA